MGLFGGSSSSSSATTVSNRQEDNDNTAADYGRIDAKETKIKVRDGSSLKDSTIIIGSDNVAQDAIAFASGALQTSADFFTNTFSNLLSSSDSRIDSANANVAATRDFAAQVIEKGQESNDDRLIKLVGLIGGIGALIVLIQSGTLKGFLK